MDDKLPTNVIAEAKIGSSGIIELYQDENYYYVSRKFSSEVDMRTTNFSLAKAYFNTVCKGYLAKELERRG